MKIFLILLPLLFFSCASKDKTPVTKMTYSEETTRTFEEIEREQLLQYYRDLRAKETVSPRASKPRASRPQTSKPATISANKPAPKSAAQKADPEELQKEIEQNLVFFCMRHRQDSRFSDEAVCKEFTAKIYQECQEKFEADDRRLFNCIKPKLK